MERIIKPNVVKNCKNLITCEDGKNGNCVGCNIWNYLYDIEALREWCRQHNEDFMLFTMQMHKCLNKE